MLLPIAGTEGVLSQKVLPLPELPRLRSLTKESGLKIPWKKERDEPGSSLRLLGPGRDDTGHARVGYELAHVLVGVDNDSQIHAVNRGDAIHGVDFTLKVLRRDRQVRLLDRFK